MERNRVGKGQLLNSPTACIGSDAFNLGSVLEAAAVRTISQ